MRRPLKLTVLVLLTVLALVAAGVIGVRLLIDSAAPPGPECTVPGDPADPAVTPATLTAVQLQHASTINAVGLARGIPERGRVIALATAYQESGLRNLDHGDRDSVGLFQQRPSQGWGSIAQIMDPVYASGKFYDALLQVSGWQQMSLTAAAQAVQYSAFPDAYAKWEPSALTLARALGGTTELELSCRAGAQASTAAAPDRPPVRGTAAADQELSAVLAAANAELGSLSVQQVSSAGRFAVVTTMLPKTDSATAARALAAWAVAHGTSMDVAQVQVQGRQWTDHRWTSAAATGPGASTTEPGAVTVSVGG